MTVGLVIVSHSSQLARGVAELTGQMVQGKVLIIPAGGAGEHILGTSAETIAQAIESVKQQSASSEVLVLLDMGSALLSAEMALELLDDELRRHVQLSFAPLVEGAIAAALEAALGRTLAEVKAAAEKIASAEQLRQLKPLPQQLDEPSPTPIASSPHIAVESANGVSEAHGVYEIRLTIATPTGLHARPASLFVQTAARFPAIVQVQRQGGALVDAASILSVLSLGIRQGETITVRASGPMAQEALAALRELVEANFYESAAPPPAQTPMEPPKPPTPPEIALPAQGAPDASSPGIWHGIATSPGFALGPAFLVTTPSLSLVSAEQHTIAPAQIGAEQQRLRSALHVATQELSALAEQMRPRLGADAAIFEAQAQMLQDPMLLNTALQAIAQQHIDAAGALAQIGEQQAQSLAQLSNPLLAARATDIRDAVGRALEHLQVQLPRLLDGLRQPSILLAYDLTPSDTVQLPPHLVLGICTVQGGANSHTAILARALGIPALAGIPESALKRIATGQEVGLNSSQGTLVLQPQGEERAMLLQLVQQLQIERAMHQAQIQRTRVPLLIGNRRIRLFANVGSVAEAEAARQWSADGIGLLRTEFLLAGTTRFPGEEEQRRLYSQVFRAFLGTRPPAIGPIVVRTLDAGADKPMPALEALVGPMREANPALGVRGVRLHLAHQSLLEQQLRALLLAAADTGVELHIMVPMITTLEELRTVRTIYTRVSMEIRQQQPELSMHVPLGIMIEVPAAALMAGSLAEAADFFSIGANDLLQYTLASDRTNAALASLYNPMQPALLRLIRDTAAAARKAGKPVAVCGEMASDPRLAPLLVGLGVDELSMTPIALAAVRASLTGRTLAELTAFAKKATRMQTAAAVEAMCNAFHASKGQ
jgi:phosphoenolpyruvate-protein phosphotransferase/dihydroxyacetone kinase phosphotransfer subunit